MRYPYIAIEGVIGAGKTTYAYFLADRLDAQLVLEEFEDNSFLPKFYKQPDKYAFPLELSFLASRYYQIQNQVENRNLFYTNIVSDFVLYKSLVFASVTLKEDQLELYRNLFDIIFKTLPIPDLTIYIYRSIESLKKNILMRNREYEINISEQYLQSIHDTYMAYFQQLKEHRIIIFDPEERDLNTDTKLQNELLHIVNQPWEPGIHEVK